MRLFDSLQSRAQLARTLFALVLIGALFVVPSISPREIHALGQVVATANLSNTALNSEAPQISAGAGRLASVWAERDTKTTGSFAYSETAVDAAFPNPTIQQINANSQYQWPDVVVDPSGTSHIIYTTGLDVMYQRRTLAGGKSTIRISTSGFPVGARIARAPNGNLWVIWRNGDTGALLYKYSTTNGDAWINGSDGGGIANGSGQALSPDIIVDQNNVPHAFWHNINGTAKGQVRYADWDGSAFVTTTLTNDGLYNADPTATVTGNTTHVVWRKQISAAPAEQWAIYHATRTVGGSWANFESIAVTTNPGFAPSVGSDSAGNLYMTHSELQAGNTRRIVLYSKLSGQKWEGPVDLKIAGRRYDSRSAVVGTTETGLEAHVLIQSELATNDAEIFYKRVSFGPPPVVLGAQPVIENNAATTSKNPVSVAFANVQGAPKELRWRWNAAPTDALNDSFGWQPFANPKAIPMPSSLDLNACQALTLYTQVKDGATLETTVKIAKVTFDGKVQATIRIANPYLAGLPQSYSVGLADTSTTPSDGAYDGDLNYTRIPQFFLGIYDAGDCSGLGDFSVPSSNFPGKVTNGKYENKVSLPQGAITNPGIAQTIGVTVLDKANNIGNYSADLIYDPADTDPSPTVTNTTGLPVLGTGGAVTADSGNSIIRTLSFSGINVTDNTYGRKENLAAGRQFWGVWIANSTSDVDPANPPAKLIWTPVRVANPSNSFTVPWSIFSGLDLGANRSKPGDYFVYVRFLDGAGNASLASTALKVKVTLQAGYTVPTYYLPTIGK